MRPPIHHFALVFSLVAAPLAPPGAAQDFEIPPEYEVEMRRITAHPGVAAALEEVLDLEDRNEALLIEPTGIPAPPFWEERRTRGFAEMVREAGFAAELDAVGNVVARRKGASGKGASGKGASGTRTVAVVAPLDAEAGLASGGETEPESARE